MTPPIDRAGRRSCAGPFGSDDSTGDVASAAGWTRVVIFSWPAALTRRIPRGPAGRSGRSCRRRSRSPG
jgi:hypothetical protein